MKVTAVPCRHCGHKKVAVLNSVWLPLQAQSWRKQMISSSSTATWRMLKCGLAKLKASWCQKTMERQVEIFVAISL